jgi:hypothetical protein
MGPMMHLALYVCATDTRRTKRYPFADGADIPRTIKDAATGDVFELVMVQYEYDRPQIREADRRALLGDVIADDTATAYGEAAA